MKKIYIPVAAMLMAVTGLSSCIEMMDKAYDADIVQSISVAFKVKAVTGFVDINGNGNPDPNFPTEGLTVRFTNFAEGSVVEAVTDESGIAVTDVVPGNYTISVSGESIQNGDTYYLNGSVQNKPIMKTVTPEEAEASNDFSVTIRPSMVGPLCFREIFYCGSEGNYFRNQFYEIYNNGDETYYLDHLCFAHLVPNNATTNLPQWPDEDGKGNFVYAVTVWQFPGTGTDYPLKPGESIVIAQEAADHTKFTSFTGAPGVMDTSKAEFEVWSGNEQRVNTDVPNLEYVFWSGSINKSQWLTAVTGSAFCIYQPGEHLKFPTINTGLLGKTTQKEVGTKTQQYVRIPAAQIIDGVELVPTSNSLNMKRIPGFVDAGAASTEASYIGVSVCRKVIGQRADGTPLYRDTNNSSDDFEIKDPPMIRRNGEGMPSWSWSMNE